MGKGGAKQYLQNKWGGKGSARDSVPSRGSRDMTRFLVFISRITFLGGKALVSQYLSAMYSCKGTYTAKGVSQYTPGKKLTFYTIQG